MLSVTKTLLQLRNAALASADKDVDPMVTPAQVDVWINEALRSLWTRLVPIARDELLATHNFTIAAPNNTFSPSTLFNFFAVRGVGADFGSGKYTRLRTYNFSRRGAVGRLSYRVKGMGTVGGTLEFQPSELASSWPLQLLYVINPSIRPGGGGNVQYAFAANGDTIDLPFGGDTYIEEHAAARIRVRAEEDPSPHLTMATAAFKDVEAALSGGSQGEAARADDWTDDDGGGFW